jgi:hypothetical protein
MKAKFGLLFLPLIATLASAQTTPALMSYQGRVADASGVLIGNTTPANRLVTFKIYNASTGGTPVYAESQTATISGGEFSVLIGNGAGVAGFPGPTSPASATKTLSDVVNGTTGSLYLGITVDDGTTAADPEISPRQQLVSGAYSLRAKVAESVASQSVTSAMILDGTLGTNQFAASSVTSAKIADATIVAADLAGSAVTAAKIDTTTVGVWTPSGASNVYRNGNVGISEANPGFPLTFGTSLSLGDKIALWGNSGATYGFGIQNSLLQIHSDGVGSDVAFGYGSSAAMTETMRIKGNGNVGIGTTAPGAKLEVDNGNILVKGTNSGVQVGSPDSSGFLEMGIATTTGSWSSGAIAKDSVIRANGGKLLLQAGTTTAGLTIDTANKIGIGTTAPNEKLTIQDGKIWFNTSTADTGGIGGTMAGNDFFRIYGYGSTDNDGSLYIDTYDDANEAIIFRQVAGAPGAANTAYERMRIASNGYVGIGTSSPTVPLTVGTSASYFVNTGSSITSGSGTYQQEGNPDLYSADGTKGVNGNIAMSISASGGIIGQFTVFRSDQRIKDIVGRSSNADDLKKIREFQITDYRMKDKVNDDGRVYKGLIAQEVEKIMPEAVSRSQGYLPDVYARASKVAYDAKGGQLTVSLKKSHELAAGDWVRVQTDKETVETQILDVPSPQSLTIAVAHPVKEAFVYGRRVDDLLAVNYDRVFTTGISAMQEMSNQLDAKETRIADLEERLTKLEKLVSEKK